MKNKHQKALDFLEFKRKLLLVLLSVGFLTALIMLMIFYEAEKKTTVILTGKLINGNVEAAKNIFKNCVVELSDGRIIVASCNNISISRNGTNVRVLASTDKKNNVVYSIVN